MSHYTLLLTYSVKRKALGIRGSTLNIESKVNFLIARYIISAGRQL